MQIDNEFSQNSDTSPYFEALENAYTSGSIAVPLTYNDPGEGKNFVNGSVRSSRNVLGLRFSQMSRAQ